MSNITQIIELVNSEELKDIITIGFIDKDEGQVKFIPIYNKIFLEFESRFIKIESKHTTLFNIYLEIIDKNNLLLEKNNEIYSEYEFCTSSLSNILIYENYVNKKINKIEAFSGSQNDYDNGIMKCIGFEIINNSYIFFDGVNLNGIEIGKRDERIIWLDNLNVNEQVKLFEFDPKKLIYNVWNKN